MTNKVHIRTTSPLKYVVHVDCCRLPKQHTSKVCALYIVEENAFTQNCGEHRVQFYIRYSVDCLYWDSSVMSYPVEQEEMILKESLSFHVGDTL